MARFDTKAANSDFEAMALAAVIDAVARLTNKRVKKRVYSAASASTLTPEIDTYDIFKFTALAAALTINNHSTSTPDDGDKIQINLLDDGTARAISYQSNYVARGGVALPTTTVVNKKMRMLFEFDGATSKFDLISVAQET